MISESCDLEPDLNSPFLTFRQIWDRWPDARVEMAGLELKDEACGRFDLEKLAVIIVRNGLGVAGMPWNSEPGLDTAWTPGDMLKTHFHSFTFP
jgi:hypothetical protein